MHCCPKEKGSQRVQLSVLFCVGEACSGWNTFILGGNILVCGRSEIHYTSFQVVIHTQHKLASHIFHQAVGLCPHLEAMDFLETMVVEVEMKTGSKMSCGWWLSPCKYTRVCVSRVGQLLCQVLTLLSIVWYIGFPEPL